MVYIVISVTGLLVAGILLSSCINLGKDTNPQLIGVSFSQNHMNFGSCYSFYLRKEDAKVLFDAEVRFEDEPYCIILESCEVDESEFKKLQNLDKEHSVTNYVSTYKKKPSLFEVSDETINKTTVYLINHTDISADTKDEHINILYEFFINLAKKHINKSVYLYEG